MCGQRSGQRTHTDRERNKTKEHEERFSVSLGNLKFLICCDFKIEKTYLW